MVCSSSFHQFIHDYQSNNRLIMVSNDTAPQTNHYYPTGVLMAKSTSQGLQPFKYNGKEFDNIHALNWYDYGARWYDPAMYLFTSRDPLCEKYYHISPYAYCAGNPVNYVDPDGRDYWSTNDPLQISKFINSIKIKQKQFDFSEWQHATDAKFAANLTYNDKTNKYYTSRVELFNDEITVVGMSFNANIIPVSNSNAGYPGAFVYKPLSGFFEKLIHFLNGTTYNDGSIIWNVDIEGRITGKAPLTGIPPFISLSGKAGSLLKNATKLVKKAKMGRSIGNMSANRTIQKEQINALCNKYGIYGEKRQELHRIIGHQGLGYHEIEELIRDYFY